MFTWKGKRVAMKPSPHIPKPIKERKPKLISICNRDEFLVESKEIKQHFAVVIKEEITPPAEIFEEMRSLLEEFIPS